MPEDEVIEDEMTEIDLGDEIDFADDGLDLDDDLADDDAEPGFGSNEIE